MKANPVKPILENLTVLGSTYGVDAAVGLILKQALTVLSSLNGEGAGK